MKFRNIDTDRKLESVVQYGDPDFEFQIFDDDFDYYIDHCINWHWHKYLELVIVLKGNVEYHIAGQKHILSEGEGVFINAYNLHMAKPAEGETISPQMFSVAFSAELLGTADRGRIYQKYVMPVISNPALQAVWLSPDVSWQQQVLSYLVEIYSYDKIRAYGYEMRIQSALFSAWQEIVTNIDEDDINHDDLEITMQRRVCEMIGFINRNYPDIISADDIAGSAGLSKSTAYRCFKRCLNTSPLEYLKEFRMNKSMQMLIAEPEISVSEVSSRCGFDSVSYFIKIFRERTGQTPLAYRKNPGAVGMIISEDMDRT